MHNTITLIITPKSFFIEQYRYTQCQAIHARSLLPCMDSPGVKATYTATVHAPEWCTVLMSAVKKGGSKHAKDAVTTYSQVSIHS